MKQQHIFKCESSGYFIEFIIDNDNNDVAYMGAINCDFINIKAFVNLLRNSCDDLIKKNIKKIQQTVTYDDWDSILKSCTTWKIISKNDQYKFYDVECDIDDFLYNYGKALDIL